MRDRLFVKLKSNYLQDDDLKRNKGTESVPGDTIESVDGKIDNEAEYQPNNIISKLFQILTSDKVRTLSASFYAKLMLVFYDFFSLLRFAIY